MHRPFSKFPASPATVENYVGWNPLNLRMSRLRKARLDHFASAIAIKGGNHERLRRGMQLGELIALGKFVEERELPGSLCIWSVLQVLALAGEKWAPVILCFSQQNISKEGQILNLESELILLYCKATSSESCNSEGTNFTPSLLTAWTINAEPSFLWPLIHWRLVPLFSLFPRKHLFLSSHKIIHTFNYIYWCWGSWEL